MKSPAPVRGSPRLPKSVVPRSYDLRLSPDLESFKFGGELDVEVEVVEPVNEIIINSAELDIIDDSVSYRVLASGQILKPTIKLETEHELLILTFNEQLEAGAGKLSMKYEGTLNDQMKGFYRSCYKVGDEKRYMAVTQFEPADARRCFPSWDEPTFKATFKITVTAPENRVVLSNMPVVSENISGSLKTVEFEKTPIMSTYLVAVVVGELSYLEGTTKHGTTVRVYAEPSKYELGKFALDVAVQTLPYYTEYFEAPYPLPKLDMVAIPDFAAGAMENYGLVTYRETALLFDEKHSASANKQRVAIVVAHELAHQWFGNLVTMEWWTHLWLNEGFATWVSYLAADYLFPEWKIWTQFNEETVEAFRLDGLVQSHPIEVEVGHVREIDEIFDAISYKKGAAIIRMLQNFLGAETFQKGLASYIKKFAYRNAATEDLWDSLSQQSGQPVRELMNSWTKQKGYPVISVELVNDSLKIEQSQFLSSGLPGSGEWVLPITLCSNSYDAFKTALVRGKSNQLPIEVSNPGDENLKPSWVKLNVGQTGFYRVQYDDHLAASLRSAIAAGSLEPADRFGILDDNYALCKACKSPMRVLLSLLEVYSTEQDPIVLSYLVTVARGVAWILADAIPAVANETKGFLTRLLLGPAKKLGWDAVPGEGDLVSMLRGDLMSALIAFDHEPTIAEARERFDAFLQNRSSPRLPADIRKPAYTAVMRQTSTSNRSGFNDLLKIYDETDLAQERTRILTSLASSKDTAMVREALDLIFTEKVRNQDAYAVLFGVSREGRATAWSWLKEHWEVIKSQWSGFLISRFVSSTTLFTNEERADEIEAFFAEHGMLAIERTVRQCIEKVRINARWVEFIREEEGFKELISELAVS